MTDICVDGGVVTPDGSVRIEARVQRPCCDNGRPHDHDHYNIPVTPLPEETVAQFAARILVDEYPNAKRLVLSIAKRERA